MTMKDTKTYRCDGCEKQRVHDFYNESDTNKMAIVEKELSGWYVLELSARSMSKDATTPLIPKAVGHACSLDCVKKAIANMVKKRMPE
jgi:hypothetical protein